MLYVTPEMWKKNTRDGPINYGKLLQIWFPSWMEYHGTSNLRSAYVLPGVDPHLEANSRDDSVRILGLAEQVLLTQWTQWTHGTLGTLGTPETSGNIRKSVKISEVKCKDV
jgi:hypothetical protein